MDIFKQAKEVNADYFDSASGNIYKIQNYNKAVKLGLPVEGIEVYDVDGNYVGIVLEKVKK